MIKSLPFPSRGFCPPPPSLGPGGHRPTDRGKAGRMIYRGGREPLERPPPPVAQAIPLLCTDTAFTAAAAATVSPSPFLFSLILRRAMGKRKKEGRKGLSRRPPPFVSYLSSPETDWPPRNGSGDGDAVPKFISLLGYWRFLPPLILK